MFRAKMYKLRSWVAWVAAGRPIDEPVVIRAGRLVQCRHGFLLISGWHWDAWHQKQTIDLDELLRRYASRYPFEQADYLDGCPACSSLVTV